ALEEYRDLCLAVQSHLRQVPPLPAKTTGDSRGSRLGRDTTDRPWKGTPPFPEQRQLSGEGNPPGGPRLLWSRRLALAAALLTAGLFIGRLTAPAGRGQDRAGAHHVALETRRPQTTLTAPGFRLPILSVFSSRARPYLRRLASQRPGSLNP
ncbi:MAG: hypothetical protein ACE5ID_12025, partial [Acidobacteriota bacterium]